MKTLTDIFYQVKTHLLKQKRRAVRCMGISNNCMYHSSDGLKCAVGCLIDDRHYTTDIENCSVDQLRYFDPDNRTGGDPVGSLYNALEYSGVPINRQTVSLLADLQKLHDNIDPYIWPERLDEIEIQLLKDQEVSGDTPNLPC